MIYFKIGLFAAPVISKIFAVHLKKPLIFNSEPIILPHNIGYVVNAIFKGLYTNDGGRFMEDKEIDIILKYKRSYDIWLCTECDTENSMLLDKCSVCGCKKNSEAVILKQWSENSKKYVMPPERTSVFTPRDQALNYENNKTIRNILIALIIIGLLVAASQCGTYAAHADVMTKYSNGEYESVIK